MLIVYYSLSNHVEELVSEMHGEKVRIKSLKQLPSGKIMQMIKLGYAAMRNKGMAIEKVTIDFSQYDEITIAFPVWSGKIALPMKTFLTENKFTNKKVKLLISCGGGVGHAIEEFKSIIDPSNEIVSEIVKTNK